MSVDFFTETIPDGEPVGKVSVGSREIEIELLRPSDRARVCDVIGICRVRPLKMSGEPKAPDSSFGRWTIDQLQDVLNAGERLPELKTREAPLLEYAKARITFEQQWAQLNPKKYRTIRIFNAGLFVGYGGSSADFWSSLREIFALHVNKYVTLKQLGEVYWTAIERVMPPCDFDRLAMSRR